ncbi:MAG: hypothetical protein HYT76_01545 [Deltaproteobacteria bacterium]|nr:hypothetical protein [Deltaproteobacteria bacterium]
MFRNIREFYKKHPVVTGAILGASVLNIFYQFSEDLFLPFYTNLLKPWIASGLKFLGINYPSFAGDNAVSQYTLLQRQQDFIRQSAEREKRMLEEIKKIREDLKDCHPIDLDMSEEGVK